MPVLIDQLKQVIKRAADRAIWYYDFALPPTEEEEADVARKANVKVFRILAKQCVDLLEAFADVQRAHWLGYADGVSLDLWAGFYRIVRQAGWSDEEFRDWIRFEILKRRCKGAPDEIKVVVAAYMSLIWGYPVPWDDISLFCDATLPEDMDAAYVKLRDWPMLGAISLTLGKHPHAVFDPEGYEPFYYFVEIPFEWLDLDFGDVFSVAGDDEGLQTDDPNDEAYWFMDDDKQGWDAGIWDGHDLVTDLMEVLWEITPAGVMPDIVVRSFSFANDDEGPYTNNPEDEAYWFVDDDEQGWDAGVWGGSVIDDEALEETSLLRMWERAGFVPKHGVRHFTQDMANVLERSMEESHG